MNTAWDVFAAPLASEVEVKPTNRDQGDLQMTSMLSKPPRDHPHPSTGLTIMQDLLKPIQAANAKYAAGFKAPGLPFGNRRGLCILTCMDARIHPEAALGLEEGDALVVRNAGGIARAALRELVVATKIVGGRSIFILHHTDCGLTKATEEQATEAAESGGDGKVNERFAFHTFPVGDLEKSLHDDVAFLRSEPLIPKDTPIGAGILDVSTGKISIVPV